MKRKLLRSLPGWLGAQPVAEPVRDQLPGRIGVVDVAMLGAAFRDGEDAQGLVRRARGLEGPAGVLDGFVNDASGGLASVDLPKLVT
jgi:hypothetical protein